MLLLSLSCTTWETQDGPADGSEYIRTNIYTILYRDIEDQVILLLLREKKFLTRAAYLAALGKKFREPIESLIECLDQIT